MANKEKEVFEFAYYSLNPAKRQIYLSNYNSYHKKISEITGYKNLITLEAIDDNNLILDFCNWNSLNDAEQADKFVQDSEEFKKFFDPVNEILFFDNLLVLDGSEIKLPKNFKVAELNLYEVEFTQIDTFNKNRKKFYDFVKDNAEGFLSALNFYSPEDDRMNIDFLFWEETELANKAHIKFNNNDYFLKMKECVRELKIWKQLKIFNPNNLE